jgi:hypothetical protein
MKKNKIDKDIKENIKWFSKLSLEKRLEIAEEDKRAIETLRSLRIEKYAGAK